MNTFLPANILIPQVKDLSKWSVIACDQFTSQEDYWNRVKENVKDAPSSLNIVLPEIYLNGDYSYRIQSINDEMEKYLKDGLFKEYENSYIYVERTLLNGSIRKGIIGMVDLEQYDYTEGAISNIRASEKTVIERIPPRKEIRKDALIECPHILLLCDDDKKELIESVEKIKNSLPVLYDFDLMENGGHIKGWLMEGQTVVDFQHQLEIYDKGADRRYQDLDALAILYATGDGNHSLATAKACYEDLKKTISEEEALNHPSRYALVELENIHDDSLEFEPIHRIIKHTDSDKLLNSFQAMAGQYNGNPIKWVSGSESGIIYLDDSKGQMPVAILQNFLDAYLSVNEGEIDYIHGDDSLISLAKEKDSIGFLLPSMAKGDLFRGIIADGVLPRKTFSMGHAQEKRYYLEARKIK